MKTCSGGVSAVKREDVVTLEEVLSDPKSSISWEDAEGEPCTIMLLMGTKKGSPTACKKQKGSPRQMLKNLPIALRYRVYHTHKQYSGRYTPIPSLLSASHT